MRIKNTNQNYNQNNRNSNTMEIIAVRTKMFLQRIVQVLKISLMKIKHRHIQKIAPLNNLTMEKQQLRLIQMNQIIVQTN